MCIMAILSTAVSAIGAMQQAQAQTQTQKQESG